MSRSIWFPSSLSKLNPSSIEEFNRITLLIFIITLKKNKYEYSKKDIKELIKGSSSKSSILNDQVITLFVENKELLKIYTLIKDKIFNNILKKHNKSNMSILLKSPLTLIKTISKTKEKEDFEQSVYKKLIVQENSFEGTLSETTHVKSSVVEITISKPSSFGLSASEPDDKITQLYYLYRKLNELNEFKDIFSFEKLVSIKNKLVQIDEFLDGLFSLNTQETLENLYDKLLSFSSKGPFENQILIILFGKIEKLLNHHKRYCTELTNSIKYFFTPYSNMCNGNCKKYKPLINEDNYLEKILNIFFDGNCCYFFGHEWYLSSLFEGYKKEFNFQILPLCFIYNEEDLKFKKEGKQTTYRMLHRINLTYSILIEYFQHPGFEKEKFETYKKLLKLLRIFTQIQFNIKNLMKQETTEGTYLIYKVNRESFESFNNISCILYLIGGVDCLIEHQSLIVLSDYVNTQHFISSFFKDMQLIIENIYNPGNVYNHINFDQRNNCSEKDKEFISGMKNHFCEYMIDSKKEEMCEILKAIKI
jgi:hypothetical protein